MTQQEGSRPAKHAARWWWLAAYVVALVAIVTIVLETRQTVLREMDTPEAHAQWQAWREAEPNRNTDGPVRRKPPASSEPPALVLMRDYFAVVMSAAIVFGSLLFAAIGLAVHGMLASGKKTTP